MTKPAVDLSDVTRTVVDQSNRVVQSYRADPGLIQEHANSERRITQGGYGSRQLYELVQNGADEMREVDRGGRIQVVLTEKHLYCANQGSPVSARGADTILRMSVSHKRGGQIGRFGVGVKSVLSVSDTPQFFSTTGSFGFDRAWSAGVIRAIHPDAGETPVLRMARVLDAVRERTTDAILDELMRHATTVVRLPLLPGAAHRLAADIRKFPNAFQLFSDHVGDLVLEDRRDLPIFRRSMAMRVAGTSHKLTEVQTGTKTVEEGWRVFSTTYVPSAEVRGRAGELHDRPEIDISWAVPDFRPSPAGLMYPPTGRGVFWSFFPTEFDTTLRGCLNAAWKTNEDRQALLRGSELNVELIEASARLVVDSLPGLVDDRDIAAYLPLLPGRVRESPNWACAQLTASVWKYAAVRPSLPDQDGRLREPSQIKVHPDGLDKPWLSAWASYPGRPSDWIHHSIDYQRDRRGKVSHVLEAAKLSPRGVREWLEALVGDGTAEASRVAIEILDDMVARNYSEVAEARLAKIVLTERNGFVAPIAGEVFRRSGNDGLRDDLVYVHPGVADVPLVAGKLGRLGVHEADRSGRFAAVVDRGFDDYGPDSWMRFWELFRAAGSSRSVALVKEKVADPLSVLCVRTLDGAIRPMRDCLIPGKVVPANGSRDASVGVDMRVHGDDRASLFALGLTEVPTLGHRPEQEEWFDEYRTAMYERYCEANLSSTASRPAISRFHLEGARTAGPLRLLRQLSPEGRAAFITHMPDEGVVRNWTSQLGREPSTRTAIPSPLTWLLTNEGYFRTSHGLARKNACVSPALKQHSTVLPVADLGLEKARKLELAERLDAVAPGIWKRVLERVVRSDDDEYIGQAYALLIHAPERVFQAVDTETRCRVGDSWDNRPDNEIAVASNRSDFETLVLEGCPAILAPGTDAAETMIGDWGMLRPADVISKETRHVPDGDPIALAEAFPALRQRFGMNIGTVQYCTELQLITRTPKGARSTPLAVAKQGSTVLLQGPVGELDALVAIDGVLGWGLGREGCGKLLERHRQRMAEVAQNEAVLRIKDADSVIDKVLLLVGEEALRTGLPEGLLDSERVDTPGLLPTPRRIAELAYNAHGDEVLKNHRNTIASRYPDAPVKYDGSHTALKFVSDFGFPEAFAGSRGVSLSPRVVVEGPREFPRLHEYQERMASNLVSLLLDPTPRRAMLCLPTGAGKTRVTAEGVIRWLKDVGGLSGPILWIAQTEELCEQAVQSWKFVWEKTGAEADLVISRLWSSNESTPTTSGPHLVVATDAKLLACLDKDAYAWLRDPKLVIVDEAHVALAPSYTGLLQQLGITSRETSRHLIGLTATAYRGRNEDETRRLVQRFGNHRLDRGVFSSDELEDAYKDLQDLGVLARVEHREIDGGELRLTEKEVADASRFSVLPRAAEQRLADDHARNDRLLNEIERMPDDWPVLLFATSVAHAKFMAAKLMDRGISAAAIDSATAPTTRRDRIEDFRRGRTRVLTNYGVLTQGFDAPATRAVVVARPVYSPNVYQQMIGRGLRGPRNGGKPTCLILNVRDNIANFGEALAFTEFEHLWRASR
ncbi:DEAD/DEAH box helicase [Nocardia sp. NPDC050406]|uniref:DEAD/DEAH box helicase n=1 Tax=Nocardia sp. NPDC050406 TaxID=3364318 RepID=UPI0037A17869